MAYNTVLFDLDGTLTDPGEGITNSVAYALNKFGIEIGDKASLYKFIGPPLFDSFEQFYGFSKEKAARAVSYYREYYKDTGIFENMLYPDIPFVLSSLKKSGKRLVVATSKPKIFAERILKHFDIYNYFDYTAGADLEGKLQKKEDIIYDAIQKSGIKDTSRTIMVGDRMFDVIGAAKFNIACIGVLYGYGTEDELKTAGAAFVAETVLDILKYV